MKHNNTELLAGEIGCRTHEPLAGSSVAVKSLQWKPSR